MLHSVVNHLWKMDPFYWERNKFWPIYYSGAVMRCSCSSPCTQRVQNKTNIQFWKEIADKLENHSWSFGWQTKRSYLLMFSSQPMFPFKRKHFMISKVEALLVSINEAIFQNAIDSITFWFCMTFVSPCHAVQTLKQL